MRARRRDSARPSTLGLSSPASGAQAFRFLARARGPARLVALLVLLPLLLLAALVGSLCLGAAALSPAQVLAALAARLVPASGAAADPVAMAIVWELRLARTLLSGVSGAALGAAGAVLQGLFRNPLADPYALGVSSGASLGAVAALALGGATSLALPGGVEAAAFGGALLAAFLVFLAAGALKGAAPTAALLLAGAAVGSFLSALVSLIITLDDRDLHRVFFWLLGGFGGKSWPELAASLPPAGVSLAVALLLARPLDLLGAGEEAARSLGLRVAQARVLAVAASSLGTAAAVASGGIIGFVGLLGPHIARLLAGPSHRALIPASACAGAALLMLADALSRSLAAPIEIPVGVITAFLGAPLFLWLLARRGAKAVA